MEIDQLMVVKLFTVSSLLPLIIDPEQLQAKGDSHTTAANNHEDSAPLTFCCLPRPSAVGHCQATALGLVYTLKMI